MGGSMMLFTFTGGRLEPILPTDGEGRVRVADNETIFTLVQASHRTGEPVAKLRERWVADYGELLDAKNILGAAIDLPKPGDHFRAIRAAMPKDVQLSLLHQVQYPNLSADEFELFVAMCDERGFSPLCRHLIPTIKPEPGGKRTLEIITTMEAFNLVAKSSAGYAGESKPQWCGEDGEWKDLWLSEEHPAACRVTAYRRDDRGEKMEYVGLARWGFYAPYLIDDRGNPELATFWKTAGPEMLRKCATACAFRAAYGSTLKGLYTEEEMEQARANRAERRQTVPPPVVDEQASPAERYVAGADDDSQLNVFDFIDEPPTSDDEFDRQLSKFLPKSQERQAITSAYRKRFALQHRTNKQAWWASVLLAASQQASRATATY
jgi:hypothetical protein